MTRTVEEFKQAAKKHGITKWPMHDCSICGYHCGFLIAGDEVNYDSGCDCITFGPVINLSSWEDLADHYNRQKNEHVIGEMNLFWGFI